MPLLLALIFYSNLGLSQQLACRSFKAYGQFIEKNGEIFFATQVGTQKEKHWPIKVSSFQERIKYLNQKNQLSFIEGNFDEKYFKVKTFTLSTKALDKSFSDDAISFFSAGKCD